MTSKLLSVSFSIWPEYLSDEQYTLEIPYKANKKNRQVFFLIRSENKRKKSRWWGREKRKMIWNRSFLLKTDWTKRNLQFGFYFLSAIYISSLPHSFYFSKWKYKLGFYNDKAQWRAASFFSSFPGSLYSNADLSNCWARRALWCPAVSFTALIGYNWSWGYTENECMWKALNKPIIKESHHGFSYYFKMHFVAARLWGFVQS